MAELVLYGAALSPFVRKVQAVLHHVGADYEIEDVDFFNMPDWFVEISPARRIPVLRDRTIGTSGIPGTIPDSSAICMYLERRFDVGLYGSNPFDAGRAAWYEEYMDTGFAMT
ncbi:MAG: glutathione S-transferase family protein, partial [Pseudomonadota bacterium]